MRYISFKILLMGGFFYFQLSTELYAEIVHKDKMIYKVGPNVFSLNDLEKEFKQVNQLKCMYEESLLLKIFKEEFSLSQRKHFKFQTRLADKSKEYFKQLIQFTNLKIYSKAQTVVIDKNVIKYLYLNAKQNKCNLSLFLDPSTFRDDFKDLVALEIFIRSRFLPTEKANRTTNVDLQKAVSSAHSLLSSISKQIENEFYW